MTLAAWRGQEALTAELIERETARGERARDRPGRPLRDLRGRRCSTTGSAATTPRATPRGGRSSSDHLGYTPFVVPELAEAASRTGDTALLEAALDWMAERTPVTPHRLGARDRGPRARAGERGRRRRARCTASRSSASARTRVRVELARSRLLYGEWLRREGRRVDAREQLRVARETLLAMGAEGFAERARHELLATGEKVRKRRDDTRDELTPQEQHIARLARDGRTNPEIGAELFLSPRTVEWHLKKVFTKLGISSRRACATRCRRGGARPRPSRPGARPGRVPGATRAPVAHACAMNSMGRNLTLSASPQKIPRLSRGAGFWAVALSFLMLGCVRHRAQRPLRALRPAGASGRAHADDRLRGLRGRRRREPRARRARLRRLRPACPADPGDSRVAAVAAVRLHRLAVAPRPDRRARAHRRRARRSVATATAYIADLDAGPTAHRPAARASSPRPPTSAAWRSDRWSPACSRSTRRTA